MEINFFLSFFVLLFISAIVFLVSRRYNKIPYTVLLVIVGMIVSLVAKTPALGFLGAFSLTPELLFFVFLPVLIFESAYNMNMRRLVESITPIALLAFVGLILSTAAIGFLMTLLSGLLGAPIPWQASLLFGAIISSTDPVAVLALFKEFGAPRRLSLIFEGESLFNDGTAVALFLALLAMIQANDFSASGALEGLASFVSMVVGGILIGLVFGLLFSYLLRFAKAHESVGIILMLVMAHLTFIFSEFLNQHLVIGGFHFHISPIISTTVASIILGNFGRSKLSPRDEEFFEKFWGSVTFLVNSIVFLLVGMLFTSAEFPIKEIWPMMVLSMIVVAVARAFSVYPVIWFVNRLNPKSRIPHSWGHLLSWGSLRGALAVIVVLLIPDTLTFANWPLVATPKELILGMTIGCILGTLLGKATTINALMKKLAINKLDPVDEDRKALALYHSEALLLEKLESMFAKKYITAGSYEAIKKEISKISEDTPFSPKSLDRVLNVYALGIELVHLKNLYSRAEVSEKVYRYIGGKLSIQIEHLEEGLPVSEIDESKARDKKDSPILFIERVLGALFPKNKLFADEKEKYNYYRAQNIIARKAVKELKAFKGLDAEFEQTLSSVISRYENFRDQDQKKMMEISEKAGKDIESLETTLSLSSLSDTMDNSLRDFKHKELLGPNVYARTEESVGNLKKGSQK